MGPQPRSSSDLPPSCTNMPAASTGSFSSPLDPRAHDSLFSSQPFTLRSGCKLLSSSNIPAVWIVDLFASDSLATWNSKPSSVTLTFWSVFGNRVSYHSNSFLEARLRVQVGDSAVEERYSVGQFGFTVKSRREGFPWDAINNATHNGATIANQGEFRCRCLELC